MWKLLKQELVVLFWGESVENLMSSVWLLAFPVKILPWVEWGLGLVRVSRPFLPYSSAPALSQVPSSTWRAWVGLLVCTLPPTPPIRKEAGCCLALWSRQPGL